MSPEALRSERPAVFHYEIWTMNGFRVGHVADGAAPTQQTFDVSRCMSGAACTVTVRFAPSVVADASAMAGRPLRQDRTFWIRQGGLALFRHVWIHAEPPPTSLVVITEVSNDVLEAASRDASGLTGPTSGWRRTG